MRTEIKIGMVVGLLLAIVIVGYLVFFQNDRGPGPGDTGPGVADSGARGDEDRIPSFGDADSLGAGPGESTGSPSEPEPSGTGDWAAPGYDRTDVDTSDTSEPLAAGPGTPSPSETGLVLSDRVEPGPADTTATHAPEDMGLSSDVRPAALSSETPSPVAGQAGWRTYVVQQGDAGFWAIAEKCYNDGRFYGLISDANPNADTNALRPGQKLRIPPKPAASAARTRVTTGTGKVVRGADGKDYYIVKRGDNGFWSVAQVAYNDGRLWRLVARANPTLDSSSLQPGDRVVVPPAPKRETSAAAGASPSTPANRAGYSSYTVQEDDDAGFWGIAQRIYKDGKYYGLIARANPSVDSARLLPGMKLTIPPLVARSAEGGAAPSVPARSVRSRTHLAEADDEPIFD